MQGVPDTGSYSSSPEVTSWPSQELLLHIPQCTEDQKKPLSHQPDWEKVIQDWEKVIQSWEKVMKPVRSLQEVYKEDVRNLLAGFREDRCTQGDKYCLCFF